MIQGIFTHTCTHTHIYLVSVSLSILHHCLIVSYKLGVKGRLVGGGRVLRLWSRDSGVPVRLPLGDTSIQDRHVNMAIRLKGGNFL